MYKLLIIEGDGIGPEIMNEARKILSILSDKIPISIEESALGGSAIDAFGSPFPEETKEKGQVSDAVLLGAVGGSKWDSLPIDQRPEKGLLGIRKTLELYANIRPLDIFTELSSASSLKPEVIKNTSMIVIRELTGDVYFGEPRGKDVDNDGVRKAFNTMVYSEDEIKRVTKIAFEIARKRRKKVCSVDKANVLESMVLWREVVTELSKEYPDIELDHMYVDNVSMAIIQRPAVFDVLLTPNMFGDILSDEMSAIGSSLGLMPSASLGYEKALYEPIHGSAPDIAGKGIANPIGMILSLAMMLEFSFKHEKISKILKNAVGKTISKGYRTKDIYTEGTELLSTSEIGDKIAKYFKEELDS